jgi:N-acyl-D-amino-acid deacylase
MNGGQSGVERCDTLIRGALIIDGTGAPGWRGDLAIVGDRIAAIGDLSGMCGGVEIEATDLALAPGFIDVHTHDDYVLLSKPEMAPKVSQGVSTVVVGNCGVSIAPLAIAGRPPAPLDLVAGEGDWRFASFAELFQALADEPPAINAAFLVGHSTLRVGTMDRLDRAATGREISAMRTALDRSLGDGAIGFSTGLAYPTAIAAPTEEVVAMARGLKEHGGIYATHMRNESEEIVAALEETFHIGQTLDVPIVISHHKLAGKASHGRSWETLGIIDEARRGHAVSLDVYPYTASSTTLSLDFMKKADRVLVAWSKAMPSASGRDIEDVAAELGCGVEEAVARLQPAGGIYFSMDEADVQRILAYPYAMIGSDGLPNDAHPHPRLWGTFPRVLGHYARDLGLFSLEEAVRRMTGYPASRFGLVDRGEIRVGAFADLVLFDPRTIKDQATFEAPEQPATGIVQVLVNGRAVWRDGGPTGERAGRVLRRRGA